MMTLKQFRLLIDSYGGRPERWPQDLRGNAEALLAQSPEARAILAEAADLDDMIHAASIATDKMLWQEGTQDAALARLRANVSAQIAGQSFRRPTLSERMNQLLYRMRIDSEASFGWLKMAGGGIAIVAGLIIGASYNVQQRPDDTLSAMLMSAPITILVD